MEGTPLRMKRSQSFQGNYNRHTAPNQTAYSINPVVQQVMRDSAQPQSQSYHPELQQQLVYDQAMPQSQTCSRPQSRRSSTIGKSAAASAPTATVKKLLNTSFPIQVVLFRDDYKEHKCSIEQCSNDDNTFNRCMVNYNPFTPRAGEIVNMYTTPNLNFETVIQSIHVQLVGHGQRRCPRWNSNWPREQHLIPIEGIIEVAVLWNLADTPGWEGFVYQRYGMSRWTILHEGNFAKLLRLVEQRGAKDILQVTVKSGEGIRGDINTAL